MNIEQMQQDIETLVALSRTATSSLGVDPSAGQKLMDIVGRLAVIRDEAIDEQKQTQITTNVCAQLTPDGALLRFDFSKAVKLVTVPGENAVNFAEGVMLAAKLAQENVTLRKTAAAATTKTPNTKLH